MSAPVQPHDIPAIVLGGLVTVGLFWAAVKALGGAR